jgi:hypothetical protein
MTPTQNSFPRRDAIYHVRNAQNADYKPTILFYPNTALNYPFSPE